ncbi:Hypothetical protein R9X50_00298600 [Acrodontium crateriforme]|uniref:Cytochrome P450 n=1 Tax=Acrodontium crateriforme TaxID=150365 RepID=A0AAQ3RBF4_9PEZI|nr:Hypothetical protein R9X50_00298600 [Acrodontium crateriforme]
MQCVGKPWFVQVRKQGSRAKDPSYPTARTNHSAQCMLLDSLEDSCVTISKERLDTVLDAVFARTTTRRPTQALSQVGISAYLSTATPLAATIMLLYIAIACAAYAVYWVGDGYRQFRINLASAKQSGLPYVCTPWHTFHRFWLVGHLLFIPILKLLPSSWTDSWLKFMDPAWLWDLKHDVFREMGTDCFMVVSPGKNTVYVADAGVVAQIVTRRGDFVKPLELYDSLDIFGKNVVTTEGAVWRHHRKITAPSFSERNNRLVWLETLHQASTLMSGIMGSEEESRSRAIWDFAESANRLSLHVISRAGFGRRLFWPHENRDKDIPEGHTMSYTDSLHTLLQNIIVVLLTPKTLMKYSPLKIHKETYESYREWGQYMRDMYNEKRAEIKAGKSFGDDNMDLMGALLKGAGITADSPNEKANKGQEKQIFTDDEIFGNAFVFILAGHETAANTINFSILFMALKWSTQKHLQEELDEIFGDKPMSEWDFDKDLPKLFGGMAGAIMNEELRMFPPVVGILKATTPSKPEGLVFDGKHITIPPNCNVTIDAIGLQRNPKFWPHESAEELKNFRAERWLVDNKNASAEMPENEEDDFDEGAGPDKRADTAASLFRPVKGAYMPFSDGHRSCIGRRFAQIEILAVLAVFFKYHSVELDVDMFLEKGEDIHTISEARKREVWDKAETRAQDLLVNGMASLLTLQMRGGKVPLRFVKRGTETFKYL